MSFEHAHGFRTEAEVDFSRCACVFRHCLHAENITRVEKAETGGSLVSQDIVMLDNRQ